MRIRAEAWLRIPRGGRDGGPFPRGQGLVRPRHGPLECSRHIVKLELGVLVLAYNLLRYVIARGQAPGKRRGIASAAAAAISFISTIPILYAARRSLVKAFAKLVAAVAADSLERRKRRNYVRAVKRRPKPYPLLTKPRSEYRPEEVI